MKILSKTYSSIFPDTEKYTNRLSTTQSKLSVFTIKINNQSVKEFESIQALSNKNSISGKLDSIKKSLNKTYTKVQFDRIISNLEIITNEKRFLRQHMELKENITEKGYIEKDTMQFFEINVKGHPSPVRITTEVHKGSIEIFTSFKISTPNQDFHDKRSEGRLIEMCSRYNIFIEKRCYLGINARENSSISVSYSYKAISESIAERIQVVKLSDHEQTYKKEIQEMREDPDLKIKLDKSVQNIIIRRKGLDRNNFIRLNKNNASVSVPYEVKSSYIKQRIESKGEEVRKKKKIITEEKIKYLKSRMNRREIREIEEKKLVEVQKQYLRQQRLEKKWLGVLYLIITADTWRENFLVLKQKKIRIRLLQMKAYKIQKQFKLRFKFVFSLNYRNLALAKNSIMLFQHMSEKIQKKNSERQLVNSFKESALYKLIPDTFYRFNSLVLNIQGVWRSYTKVNNQRLVELSIFWSKTANALATNLSSKKRSKKKIKAAEKLMKIPMETKDRVLREHLHCCKIEFLRRLRNLKPAVLEYIPDEETMKKILLSLISENSPKKVKSTNQS